MGDGPKEQASFTQEVARLVKSASSLKVCACPGCENVVKKATARYCSIRCCAQDPVRQERLRRQARRAAIVPLVHQLSMVFQVHSDIETVLDARSLREDVPAGLQRLRAG